MNSSDKPGDINYTKGPSLISNANLSYTLTNPDIGGCGVSSRSTSGSNNPFQSTPTPGCHFAQHSPSWLSLPWASHAKLKIKVQQAFGVKVLSECVECVAAIHV